MHNGKDNGDIQTDRVVSQSTISRDNCCGVIIALTKLLGIPLLRLRL